MRQNLDGPARAAERWLQLAAAPVFGVMAILAAIDEAGAPAIICAGAGLASSGMVAMYLLMGVFHLGPWLRRISRQTCHSRRSPSIDEPRLANRQGERG
ncbi:hypothetical protein STAQ_22740 [Allostella sp. ATCC 35155]|nr:hypothetical protein STAQ_22740 [Stella sp. ATCC 35155]